MENIKVLELAVKNMEAHNDLCGYVTFENIVLDADSEKITFNMAFQFMQSAIEICNILNLSVQIKAHNTFTIS